MTSAQRRDDGRSDGMVVAWPSWTTLARRALPWSIAVLAAAMAGFIVVTFAAPRLAETLQPDIIQSDGEQAFVQGLSFEAPWPYTVPSHPDFRLSPSDTGLFQDGNRIGGLEASHADIRRFGGGRYDFWQGSLWFSTTGPDPRDSAHVFTFSVATRLSPDVAAARLWCAVMLLALTALEVARSTAIHVIYGPERHAGPARRAAVRIGLAVVATVDRLWRLRRSLPVPFLVVNLGLLVGWTLLALRQPASFLYGPDSYTYIEPALRLVDGQSMAGMSLRNLGYPLLAFLALRLGSIADAVPIQFGMVMLAMASMLLVLATYFTALARASGFAPGRVPVLLTIGASAVGLSYSLLLFSHNAFVIDLYSLMAEAPHFLPMAVALLCFVGGWSTSSRRGRILMLSLAADAAFLSTVVKPSSILAFGVCAVSAAVACLLHPRQLRSAIVLCTLALSVGLIGIVHHLDVWASPRDADFGAKVLFCNHLDSIDGHLEANTPERARVKDLIAHVLGLGPLGWPEQGYNGDQCMFVQDFTDAVAAAARSEAESVKDWEMHEFVTAVAAHPLRYARHVGRQILHFARNPVLDDIDMRGESRVSDKDWTLLNGYSAIRAMPRAQFEASIVNWFEGDAPDLVALLKLGIRLMASTFALVALSSTALALRAVFRTRVEARLKVEVVLLSVALFTTALPLAVALSHSFDISRYSIDILPFTILWWCMGLVYLSRGLVHGMAARRLKRRGSRQVLASVSN